MNQIIVWKVHLDTNFDSKLCLKWNSTLTFMVYYRTKVCGVMICSVKRSTADNLWRCFPRLQKLNQSETKRQCKDEFHWHSGSSVKRDTTETSCDVPKTLKLKQKAETLKQESTTILIGSGLLDNLFLFAWQSGACYTLSQVKHASVAEVEPVPFVWSSWQQQRLNTLILT